MAFVHGTGLDGREADLSLTPAQKRDAQEIFRAGTACGDCGGIHQRACPRVMEKEFHPNGNIIRVRYFARYDDTGVIWPEDAFDPDEEDAGGR